MQLESIAHEIWLFYVSLLSEKKYKYKMNFVNAFLLSDCSLMWRQSKILNIRPIFMFLKTSKLNYKAI
jgi:hypothetical protein